MKKGTVTAAALVLALLAQAATAVVPAPCPMSAPDPETAARTIQRPAADRHPHPAHHAHPAGHDQPSTATTDDKTESTQPGDGDCCDGMSPTHCAAGSCTAGAGAVLNLPVPDLASVRLNGAACREPSWLPPYLTPISSLFRPPIA